MADRQKDHMQLEIPTTNTVRSIIVRTLVGSLARRSVDRYFRAQRDAEESSAQPACTSTKGLITGQR